MRTTAQVTASVMDAMCGLPGVATLDWCDRAAVALSRIHDQCGVLVAVGRLDARGFLVNLEAAGTAVAPTSTVERRVPRPGEDPEPFVALPAVRRGLREGDWIGWNPVTASGDACATAYASQQGLLAAGSTSPLARRWQDHLPSEILLGASSVTEASAGRMIFVEIASRDTRMVGSPEKSAVLAACLPILSRKLGSALGPTGRADGTWLTPREELVLWHLVAGKKVPQIAAELHRSIYTVHDHVKSLHRKLGACNRGQLVARALGHLGPLSGACHQAEAKPHTEKPAKADDAEERDLSKAASWLEALS